MTDLYQEHIMEHFYNPRNRGSMRDPDIYFKDSNPLCGDEVAIYARIRKGRILNICFLAVGCAISQASASILTEQVKDKPLAYVKGMTSQDLIGLMAIPLSHSRVKCAVLPLKVLQAGIVVYEGKHGA
ncbi:iron-sulfur cluster assembly scaffold protein [Candidatus Woesearchaeota archaeon]|nr:iron-sulfur cluster assembly scaffold protein [Candidatus Woesearchaeota archaeon]